MFGEVTMPYSLSDTEKIVSSIQKNIQDSINILQSVYSEIKQQESEIEQKTFINIKTKLEELLTGMNTTNEALEDLQNDPVTNSKIIANSYQKYRNQIQSKA